MESLLLPVNVREVKITSYPDVRVRGKTLNAGFKVIKTTRVCDSMPPVEGADVKILRPPCLYLHPEHLTVRLEAFWL